MTATSENIAQRIMQWLGVLRRHVLLEIPITLLVFTAAAAFVMHMPDVYRAETRILVNPQRVSDKYVSNAISMSPNEWLNTLSQQVLSTTRLESIIEDFNLFPRLRRTMGREQVIDIMRRHIAIELKQSSDGPSSFTLAYLGESPWEVAQVTNRLAQLFIVSNLHDRAAEAQGTTAFLSRELTDSKSQLDELEAQISSYKLQHIGELPEQLDANMQTLSRLQIQLQGNIDAQNRLDHEAFLAKVEPASIFDGGPSNASLSPRQQLFARDAQAHRDLAQLREHYTAEFPDVVAKQEEVKSLDAQLEKLPKIEAASLNTKQASPSSAMDPRLELIASDRTRLVKEQQQIEAKINAYQSRVNAEPIREQEMAQRLRDYDTAKDHYRSLLEKTYSAQMAMELERRQEGGSFTLLDPARPPDAPIGPNRIALLTASFLFAFAAGVSTGFFIELLDTTIKSEAELRYLLPGMPVLGLTPRLGGMSPNAFDTSFVNGGKQ
ncbi:MAG: GumC family protein [Acidobacteriaceae bacterium]